jgi:pimeloyl-ACP methyl ester carboxylesterase
MKSGRFSAGALVTGIILVCSSLAGVRPVDAASTLRWYSPATVGVIREPITFSNEGATLHGTVYIPNIGRKVPAIVVLHGASDPLASTPLYQHLSAGLPQIGVAVLLFDRRGTGASSGDPEVSYATLTDDGIAGARAIRRLPNIDPNRVGYWGISQGGWLATFATSRDPQAAFAVAVSAPLVTAESQMEFAMSNQLSVLGYNQTDIDAMLAARYKLDGYYNGLTSRADAVAALRSIQDKPWFKLMYLPRADAVPASPEDSVWRKQMDLDSFAALLRVKVPILFVLGDSDPWIPVSRTVALLATASAKNVRLSYVVVPNANHLMMTPPAREQMTDASPAALAVEQPEVPAYFMILAAWLERNVI